MLFVYMHISAPDDRQEKKWSGNTLKGIATSSREKLRALTRKPTEKERVVRSHRGKAKAILEAEAAPEKADVFQQGRKLVLDYMQKKSCLKKSSDGKNWLIDLELFKQLNVPTFLSLAETTFVKKGPFAKNTHLLLQIAKKIKTQSGYVILLELLKDFKAIALKNGEYDKNQKSKKVIFQPNPEDPFDINQYRNPDTHLSLLDLGKKFQYNTISYPDLNLLDSQKSWILYYIYHPDHGNGKRLADGTLEVTYRDRSGKPVKRGKISTKWLRSNSSVAYITINGKILAYSPCELIENNCEDLNERGLLKLDDFRRTSQSSSITLLERSIERRDGRITLNGQSYNLGKAYQGGKMIQADEGVALLQKEDGEQYIFYPLDTEGVRLLHKTPEAFGKKDPRTGTISRSNPDFDWKNRLYKIPDYDLGVDLEKILLKSRIFLFSFLHGRDKSIVTRLKNELDKQTEQTKINVLSAFSASSENREFGMTILELLEKYPRKAKRIFEQFHEIMNIFEGQKDMLLKKIRENRTLDVIFNISKFYSSITKRGIDFLRTYLENPEINFESFMDEAQKYQQDLVTLGASFSAFSSSKSNAIKPETLNKIFEDVHVEVVKGGDLVKSDKRDEMRKSGNYLQPEAFNIDHYHMLVSNLERTYSEIDPGWLEHLIDNIPRDLQNPNVNFILIKNKKNELIGIYKTKKLDDKRYYSGTLYVDPAYQQNFGIGRYLNQYLRTSLIPEGASIECTVAGANPAAARHIDGAGYVGINITTEGEGRKKSRPLILLDNRPVQRLETKDKKMYSEEVIRKIYGGKMSGILLPNIENIKILLADTTSDNVESYTAELQPYFNKGYRLTRFFYDKGNDAKKTYLVLEKSAPEKELIQKAA